MVRLQIVHRRNFSVENVGKNQFESRPKSLKSQAVEDLVARTEKVAGEDNSVLGPFTILVEKLLDVFKLCGF